MLVSEIATLLEYEMVGEDCEICGISWFDSAEENDIAVIKKKEELQHTQAKVVLTKPIFAPINKTMLFTFEEIECALVRVCQLLIMANILEDYSVPTQYRLNGKGYYIGENCEISEKTIIQPGVMIGDNVVIGEDCVIDPYVVIGSGTVLGNDVHIGAGSQIGIPSLFHYYMAGKLRQFSGCGIVKIGNGTRVGCNTSIQRGTITDTLIGSDNILGNGLDIGHDVKIGNGCKIVSQTGIAGDVTIKDNVMIYGQVGISNNLVIGNNVIIKARTAVTKSIGDNEMVYGPFGRDFSDEMKLIAKVRKFFS